MKAELFQTLMYRGPDHGGSWPVPPRLYDPGWGSLTYEQGLAECVAAHDAGFDSLNFAEHHYSPKRLSPDPLLYASIVGRELPDAQIGLFGTDLPLHNPVHIAERYAMLDNLLGGRIRIGMLRGTPTEYLTYGTNPWESRDRFEEAVLLLQRCFTEPEPFGWEGRYYRHRTISIWPAAVQQPHPRILISGTSEESAAFAGRHRLDLGISYLAPEQAAASLERYRRAAAEAGWEPTADNVTYRHCLYVAESDAAAHAVVDRYGRSGILALFPGGSPDFQGTIRMVGAAMGGAPKGTVPPSGSRPPLVPWPGLFGSPHTVLAKVREAREQFAFGRLEFFIGVGADPIPHDLTMRAIELVGESVIPALHEERY